jgi:hypothetical protein
MAKLAAKIGTSLCDGCSRVHLDLFFENGDVFTQPLDDDEWDSLFISFAKMKRERDHEAGEPVVLS